ncbi:MAG: hypothetical protein ACREKK_02725 [Candidatus Methylomirabilales bacterium]
MIAQVKVGRIVAGECDWTGARVPVPRRWARRAGETRPAPASPYQQAIGYEQFRRKVLTGRPFSYRAAMDRPFPDPGLNVGVASVRMLPAVNPWGRYTVPHPGRRALMQPAYPTFGVVRFPDRPTLSEATGYYTASEEALGLGDPGKFSRRFKRVLRKVAKVASPVLRIAAPALSFIPGIGIPLAAAVSLTGQMIGARKPLSIFRKPLRVFGETAAAASFGSAAKWAYGAIRGAGAFAPTGNVPTAEILREAGAPPPMPAIGWGEIAQTVGQVATAAVPLASQLLQRSLPGAPSEVPGVQVMDGGWGTPVWDPSGQPRYLPGPGPAEGAYVPGSAGSPGSPAEAGPVGAPGMVQEAGMFGGPMMMPLLVVGGVVALLAATR